MGQSWSVRVSPGLGHSRSGSVRVCESVEFEDAPSREHGVTSRDPPHAPWAAKILRRELLWVTSRPDFSVAVVACQQLINHDVVFAMQPRPSTQRGIVQEVF